MQEQELATDDTVSTSYYKKSDDDYNNTLPWYHGSISDELTETLLSEDEDGLFLVRDSITFPGDFTLCIKYKKEIYEYRIKRFYTNQLTIDEEEYFDSLEELIETYKEEAQCLCVTLTNYILKECEVNYINSEDITIERTGHGEFGRLYIGLYNGRKILLKKVEHVDTVKAMLKKSVCHENLMNMIGLTKLNDVNYLASCFSRYGTLLDVLRAWSKTTCVRKFAYNFSYDICCGMEYLEKKYIAHKYLAARNVWISRNGIAKLSNFGLCEEYMDSFKHLLYRHFAPEVLIAKRHGHFADMWSFGVTLWEMFSNGAVPYTDHAYYRILKYLRNGKRLPKPRGCPNDMYTTMLNCWQWRSYERPRFSEMKKKFAKLRIELYHPEFLLEF